MLSHAERIEQIRKRLVETKEGAHQVAGQRLYHFWKGVEAAPKEWSAAKKLAAGTKRICEAAEPFVDRDQMFVGYNYCNTNDYEQLLELAGTLFFVGAPSAESLLNTDYARTHRDLQNLTEYLHKGSLTQEQIEEAIRLSSNQILFPDPEVPEPEPLKSTYRAAERDGACVALCISNNHTVLGYERVLQHGFSALTQQITERLLDPELTADQRDELEAMRIFSEGGEAIGLHFANRLNELADAETDAEKAAEYREMATVCERVPKYGARTLREAIQALWFAHILNTWEDMINANSIGRLDQMLYPFYQKDVAEGRITREEARTMLAYLWLLLYRDYDVQQVTLGGLTPDGQDAANDLTELCLDVSEQLGFVRCQSLRLHKNSSRKLVQRALEVIGHNQNGVPFFFNDDVLVPAQIEVGIPPEDACSYAPLGCVEITIPGKSNPHAVSNRVNLLKCLEYALNDGCSLMQEGERVGAATGAPDDFTYEQLCDAFYAQMERITRLACEKTNYETVVAQKRMRLPYKSLLTDGCIESGLDFNAGGPVYNYFHSMPMAIPNVADALTAIRKQVFEQKRFTLREVIEQMRANFPDEAFRLALLNGAPKYGNDVEEVDLLAGEITSRYIELLKDIPSVFGLGFFAQPFTYLWVLEQGSRTAASADGRRAGEPLAYSISPMQGRDANGLTAAFQSLSKIPAEHCPGSVSSILEVEPVLFSEENLPMLTDLLMTAIEMGVGQVQFNVVTAETLKAAQAEPDKYRNLAVRVSGFSQKFCLLGKDLQDHIIARTKHATL